MEKELLVKNDMQTTFLRDHTEDSLRKLLADEKELAALIEGYLEKKEEVSREELKRAEVLKY